MTIQIVQADLHDPRHVAALLAALSAYALDPMGGAAPLSDFARANLVPALLANPQALSVLIFVDGEVAGLANCFMGFSTFACRPLLNIHDFVILSAYRGRGLGVALMTEIEAMANARNCCKLTLEVLTGNTIAQDLYRKAGFDAYTLGDDAGHALFWQKKLAP